MADTHRHDYQVAAYGWCHECQERPRSHDHITSDQGYDDQQAIGGYIDGLKSALADRDAENARLRAALERLLDAVLNADVRDSAVNGEFIEAQLQAHRTLDREEA